MTHTVTGLYDTLPEAEAAAAHVAAGVELSGSQIVSSREGPGALGRLRLSEEERAACQEELAKGGFLLIAQVDSEARADRVVELLQQLEDRAEAPAPRPALAPAPAFARASAPAAEPTPAPAAAAQAVEERIPLVEEELRVGTREVKRGGARVHSFVTEVPVREQVELREEHVRIDRRPADRKLSEEDIARGGLLQERVIEVSAMREEAVVTKEAFVREELIVTKSVERRVEQIEDTVRRTEVEVERLPADERKAFSRFGGDPGQR